MISKSKKKSFRPDTRCVLNCNFMRQREPKTEPQNTSSLFSCLTEWRRGKKYFETSINRNASAEKRLFSRRRANLRILIIFLPKTINPKSLLPSVVRRIILLFLYLLELRILRGGKKANSFDPRCETRLNFPPNIPSLSLRSFSSPL